MGPMVTRQVSQARRVGLPKRLAGRVGIAAGGFVTVAAAGSRGQALLLRPAQQDRSARVRDEHRPRPVTAVLQVTLPAPLMQRVGLACGDWVFLTEEGPPGGLRLVPQASVLVTEKPRAAKAAARTGPRVRSKQRTVAPDRVRCSQSGGQ